MDTCRVFIRWLESIDGVEQDLSEMVISPTIRAEEKSRDVMLDTDRAFEVLTHMEKYEYASVEHVTISLMWHTMIRRGEIRALDLDDYNRDEQYLALVHRPDTGMQLKSGTSGERLVVRSDEIGLVLDDYTRAVRLDIGIGWLATRHDHPRPGFEFDHREGLVRLVATMQGRPELPVLVRDRCV